MVNESAGSKGGVRCQRWIVRLEAGQNYRRAPAGRVGATASPGRGPSFRSEGPGVEQGSDTRDFLATATRRVQSTHKPLSRSIGHDLPRRCRSVVRLFSPVLILTGRVPGRVAVFDFRVHQ
jgi:hypothetical protein